MKLVGLTGRRGSGKDTAFGFISGWAERRDLLAMRRGFTDKLKHSAAIALGFDVEEQDAIVLMNELKDLGEITTCVPNQSILYTIDGRKFLQLYGTEAHRDVFGPDFWVDAILPTGYATPVQPKWWHSFPQADLAVVTDVRFDNEAERIKELGGQIWEVQRGGLALDDMHASEAGIAPDMIDTVIYNNTEGDLEPFMTEIEFALDSMTGSAPR